MIARLQTHKIINDKLVWFDKGIFSVTNYTNTLSCHKRQAVNHAFCTNLLHNTNDQVCKNYTHEQCVSVLSRYNNKQRHQNINYVKERKAVLCNNLSDRFGFDVCISIDFTCRYSLCNFF